MASLALSSFFESKFHIQERLRDFNQKWTNFKAYLNGRLIIPASYYLLIGGTAAGLISSIAMGIFQQYPLLVASIAITLTNGIGAYLIRRLTLEKIVEETNPALEQQVQELNQIIAAEALLYQQLGTEITTLKSTLQNHKKIISDKQTEIKNCIDRIEELTKRIEASESKLSKLNSLQAPINNTVATFVKFTNSFLTSSGTHLDSSKQLLQETQAGHIVEDALKNEGANFSQSIKIIEAIFKQASEVSTLLIQQVQAMQNNHKQSLENSENAKNELNYVKQKIVDSEIRIAEIQAKENKLQELINKLKEGIPHHHIGKMDALKKENERLEKEIKAGIISKP